MHFCTIFVPRKLQVAISLANQRQLSQNLLCRVIFTAAMPYFQTIFAGSSATRPTGYSLAGAGSGFLKGTGLCCLPALWQEFASSFRQQATSASSTRLFDFCIAPIGYDNRRSYSHQLSPPQELDIRRCAVQQGLPGWYTQGQLNDNGSCPCAS